MPFDIRALKTAIRDELRDHLYPRCLYGTIEATLSTSTDRIDLAQSFVPYSKCYSTITPYSYTIPVTLKIKKYGSPDEGIVVSLQSDNDGVPSGSTIASSSIPPSSIPSSLSTVSTSLVIDNMLTSFKKYWLVIESKNSLSDSDYYTIAKDSVDTHYIVGSAFERYNEGNWSSLNVDLYFNFKVKGFIYNNYPHEKLSIHNYPRIAVDMIGRPRVEQRWIDRKLAKYHIDMAVVIFSAYTDELEDLASYVDRILWSSRLNISNVRILNPSDITPISIVDERKFSRAVRFTLEYRMIADY